MAIWAAIAIGESMVRHFLLRKSCTWHIRNVWQWRDRRPRLGDSRPGGVEEHRDSAARAGTGNLQFRAEFFNALNHAAFGDPNMAAGTAQFGVIRSTRINGREIQLALKFLF